MFVFGFHDSSVWRTDARRIARRGGLGNDECGAKLEP
jgi:hypothetical protein